MPTTVITADNVSTSRPSLLRAIGAFLDGVALRASRSGSVEPFGL